MGRPGHFLVKYQFQYRDKMKNDFFHIPFDFFILFQPETWKKCENPFVVNERRVWRVKRKTF